VRAASKLPRTVPESPRGRARCAQLQVADRAVGLAVARLRGEARQRVARRELVGGREEGARRVADRVGRRRASASPKNWPAPNTSRVRTPRSVDCTSSVLLNSRSA
jgi:hypothetical protein